MKYLQAIPGIIILLFSGCSHPEQKREGLTENRDMQGQWILQSYDATKGYTFLKDGVQYQAHCQVFRAGGKAHAVVREGACIDVLPYLHKAVSATLWEDELTVKNPNPKSGRDWEVVFLIIGAK